MKKIFIDKGDVKEKKKKKFLKVTILAASTLDLNNKPE